MEITLRRRPLSIPLLPIVTVVVLAIVLISAMRIARVQANQIGVFVNNLTGGIEVETMPGAQLYNGLITDFYLLDNTVQTIHLVAARSEEINLKTRDGADVTLDVEVNYRLVQEPNVIRDKVIPECGLGKVWVERSDAGARARARDLVDAYVATWIRDYARSAVRYVFGELGTNEFYQQATAREQKAHQAEVELNRLLEPHGITVLKVVPDKFHFYREYEDKIAEKNAAEQEVLTQQELAKAALKDQERRLVEATAQKTVAIEARKGELQKAILQVEAEASKEVLAAQAYAFAKKQAADADYYKAKNEAQGMLAAARTEAEGLKQLAGSLTGDGAANLVRLEYAKALKDAVITGVPYATDPRIQKVEVTPVPQPQADVPLRAVGAASAIGAGGGR